MNPITNLVAKMSVGPLRYLGRTALCFPDPDFQLADGRGAQAETSVPVADDQSKATKPAGEVVGFGLVLSFLLVVGTAWAWIIVKLAMMLSELQSLLVHNILRTHQ